MGLPLLPLPLLLLMRLCMGRMPWRRDGAWRRICRCSRRIDRGGNVMSSIMLRYEQRKQQRRHAEVKEVEEEEEEEEEGGM